MVSVEEKIKIFQNELQSQIDALKSEELQKANAEANLKETLAEQDIQAEVQAIKDRYNKLETRNYARIIAEGNKQARDLILTAKDDIRKNFIKVIQKDCDKYLNSDIYKKYLKESLANAAENLKDSKSIILFINEVGDIDKDFFSKNLKGFDIEYRDLPKEDLGGFIIQDSEGRVNYDYSLFTLIDDNTERIDHYLEKIVDGELN